MLTGPRHGAGPSFDPVTVGAVGSELRSDVVTVRSARRPLPNGEGSRAYQSFDVKICGAIRMQGAVDLQPARLVGGSLLAVEHAVLDGGKWFAKDRRIAWLVSQLRSFRRRDR
jgi:hypothetical protein